MILDIKKPFIELGNDLKGQADYVFQDGKIFCWSESNIRYEYAWWLDRGGAPVGGSDLADNVAQSRPFDPAWLNVVML